MTDSLQVPIVPIVVHEYLGEDGTYNAHKYRFNRPIHLTCTVLDPIDTAGCVPMPPSTF